MNNHTEQTRHQSTVAISIESSFVDHISEEAKNGSASLLDTILLGDFSESDFSHLRNYVLYNVIVNTLLKFGINLDYFSKFPDKDFTEICELTDKAEAKAYVAIDFAEVAVSFIHELSDEQALIHKVFSETGLFQMRSGENEDYRWIECRGKFDLPWETVLKKGLEVLDGLDREWVIYVIKNWRLLSNAPLSLREVSGIDPDKWKAPRRDFSASPRRVGKTLYCRV